MPDFETEEPEDYYTYYVLILGISENVFWNSDYAFLQGVALNKMAYDGWRNSIIADIQDKEARSRIRNSRKY